MSGRVDIWGVFGTSPSVTVNLSGHINFTAMDDSDSRASTNPIGKPVSGTNTSYSHERWMQFKCVQAPVTQLSNFRVWSGVLSSPATGVIFRASTTDSYVGSSGVKSTVAISLFHDVYNDYNDALIVGGSLSVVDDVSDFFVLQCEINSAAAQGPVDSTRTIIHFAFDEN